MKEVIYQNIPKNKIFLITDAEFSEAAVGWLQGKDYVCERLEALLPPRYKWVATPDEDLDYEVFVRVRKDGWVGKVFLKENKYFQESINADGTSRKIRIFLKNAKEVAELIPQEEYYEKKKYLAIENN